MSASAIRFHTVVSITNRTAIAEMARVREYLSGRASWRVDASPARQSVRGETWDRAGVHALVDGAAQEFARVTGHSLPENLSTHGCGSGAAWGKKHPRAEGVVRVIDRPANRPFAEFFGASVEPAAARIVHTAGYTDPVAEAARLAGFLRAAPQFPVLRELITRTTSVRGVNSPRTTLHLFKVAERWSPGAAERQLRAVKARANEILSPAGLRVSWRALGDVLAEGPRQVGKAAVCAAAGTLQGYGAPLTYREGRKTLAERMRTVSSVARQDDGIMAHEAGPSVQVGDILVTPAWWVTARPFRRTKGWIATSARGETFHADWVQTSVWTGTGYASIPAEEAVAMEASRAFEKREKAAEEARLPSNVTVLVTRADSRKAGNCDPGTAEFIRRHGWESRWYIPAGWIWEDPNALARRAARVAVREVRAAMR